MAGGRSGDRVRTLERVQAAAAITFVALIVFLAVADTLIRAFIAPDFRVGELIFGGLVAALLAILGVRGLERIPGLPRERAPEPVKGDPDGRA